MKYTTITEEQLTHLLDGLKIIETLNEYDEPAVKLYLFGLSSDPTVLDVVRAAVHYWVDDEEGIEESDIKVNEAVVIIPVSSDALYYLTGSGLALADEEVIYTSPGEGPRDVSLRMGGSGRRVRVTPNNFSHMAVSRDDVWAKDFLIKYGTKSVAQMPKATQPARSEEGTTKEPLPAAPAAAPTPGRENVIPMKKQTSLEGINIDEFLEGHDARHR